MSTMYILPFVGPVEKAAMTAVNIESFKSLANLRNRLFMVSLLSDCVAESVYPSLGF